MRVFEPAAAHASTVPVLVASVLPPRTRRAFASNASDRHSGAARGDMTRGPKLQDQHTEREQDLSACASFRCGEIWSVVPVAELLTQKGSERLKLCNRSVQQL